MNTADVNHVHFAIYKVISLCGRPKINTCCLYLSIIRNFYGFLNQSKWCKMSAKIKVENKNESHKHKI